ncbi:CCA tRNA nucleotidyltransferase [Candidatus Micrarchaeota archaeon]|nr:CCA tRNA nucleotidyltransferase [Candidatus Micrarchaeota archaeon]
MTFKRIFDAVLQIIKPTETDYKREKRFVSEVIRRIRAKTPKNFQVKVTGSVAKGTFLKRVKDVDIFVLVPKSIEKKEFEKIVRKIVTNSFGKIRMQVRYAEHPYVHIEFQGRHMDIVPAYRIRNAKDMRSAVDRSVLHTKFINKKLKKNQIPEVLLFKQFLKANGLYGAEIKIEGLSGYLCELLILKFSTFLNLLRFFSRKKKNCFIDIVGDGTDKKFNEPLVVIDPIDRNRNVAAVVSEENLTRMNKLARAFLRRPSLKFFERDFEKERLKLILSKNGPKYEIRMEKPDVVDDILWGQFKRLYKNMQNFLERNEFEIKGHYLEANGDCRILVCLKKDRLSASKIMAGPPLKLKKNLEQFKKIHKNAKIGKKNQRSYAIVTRKLIDVNSALKEFFRGAQNIPSHFAGSKIKIKKIS